MQTLGKFCFRWSNSIFDELTSWIGDRFVGLNWAGGNKKLFQSHLDKLHHTGIDQACNDPSLSIDMQSLYPFKLGKRSRIIDKLASILNGTMSFLDSVDALCKPNYFHLFHVINKFGEAYLARSKIIVYRAQVYRIYSKISVKKCLKYFQECFCLSAWIPIPSNNLRLNGCRKKAISGVKLFVFPKQRTN